MFVLPWVPDLGLPWSGRLCPDIRQDSCQTGPSADPDRGQLDSPAAVLILWNRMHKKEFVREKS